MGHELSFPLWPYMRNSLSRIPGWKWILLWHSTFVKAQQEYSVFFSVEAAVKNHLLSTMWPRNINTCFYNHLDYCNELFIGFSQASTQSSVQFQPHFTGFQFVSKSILRSFYLSLMVVAHFTYCTRTSRLALSDQQTRCFYSFTQRSQGFHSLHCTSGSSCTRCCKNII